MRKILIPLLIIAVFGFARTAGTAPSQPGHREFQILRHNINQVEMSISNYGKFGQSGASVAGCWWPKGSGQNYIFGAGSWFGTIDQATSDTLVTIGYGPHGGEAEYGCGMAGWSISDPNAVIFMYPTNWPPPADKFPGVPVPASNKSHQDSWCVYNDLDATYHMAGDTRPIGLEVYQTVYAWNLSSTQDIIFIRYELKNVSGAKLNNCFFGVCTDNDIGNESGTNANDRISGIVHQWYHIPPGSADSLLVDNLGYQWQEDPEAGWTPSVPGAIGFDYLQSPYDLVVGADKDGDTIPDEHERDSAYFWTLPPIKRDWNFNGVPDWRDPAMIPQYGMTAFKRFTLNLEPNKDNERYVTMAGFNFKTGAYEPFDTVPPPKDDQRFLQVSGPFELEADSSTTVLVGIIFAYWFGTYGFPDTALVKIDNTCQFIYNMNWLLPGPPPPPTLVCVPGDKKVTLVWSNAPENYPDPYWDVVSKPGILNDPYYLQYDFEGYRIWRSPTGGVSDWQLLTSFDKANGIEFVDSVGYPDSIALEAVDNGIVHSFVDDDVRNGFTYYYAVTSFDYNYVRSLLDSIYLDTFYIQYDTAGNPIDTVWDYDTVQVIGPSPLWFESGQVGVNATPRRDPANYVEALCSRVSLYGNPYLADSNVFYEFTSPFDMTPESIFVEFWPIRYDSVSRNPVYTVYMSGADHAAVDSILVAVNPYAGSEVTHQFAQFKGMNVTASFAHDVFTTGTRVFDSVRVNTGTYPAARLTIPSSVTSYWNFWGYRGCDYQITWKNTSGSPSGPANTVEVKDLITNQILPYGSYKDTTSHYYDKNASGWCFRSLRTFSDTLVLYGVPAAQYNTKQLYIGGGLFNLNGGGHLLPTGQLPQVGEVWTAYGNADLLPAPANAIVALLPTPGYLDSITGITLNVKVVPNPYIVNNEWQRSSLIRRMRFINLPGRCTIRIFNLNGELIRTINHTETITPEAGSEVKNNAGGDEWWDLLSENRQLIASGVYIFHIESPVGEQIGKFAVVR